MVQRRHTVVATVALIVTAAGLIEATKGFLQLRTRGVPVPFSDALINNVPWWWAWGALSIVVVWVARSAPLVEIGIRRSVLAKRIVLHAAMAILISATHLAVVGSLFFYTTRFHGARQAMPMLTLPRFLTQWFMGFIMSNLVTYALIVGAFYAYVYVQRYAEAAQLSAELRHRITEARLEALRKELDPHFLFNTLNAISGLVRRQENVVAVTMLARLGELLRATLDRGITPEVTVREEIDLLECYLDIERARFADRLSVDVSIASNVGDALVPSLALQPLVENAIRHGLGKRPGHCTIEIRAERSDEQLIVSVRDTGTGFEALDRITEGVGLSNTRARLEQLYNGRARLIRENWQDGAYVALEIPYHTRKPQGADVHALVG